MIDETRIYTKSTSVHRQWWKKRDEGGLRVERREAEREKGVLAVDIEEGGTGWQAPEPLGDISRAPTPGNLGVCA
jgi:hypothetical protein